MTHPLLTDEMVKRSIQAGYEERKNGLHPDIRAALEAVIDDVRNAVIDECAQAAIKAGFGKWAADCFIRSLKANPCKEKIVGEKL